jgi:phosphoribosyl-ATP pyrophosphohydrolase
VIVPSIDLMGGRTVQLVGGRELAIDAGDPRPLAERFALAGEVAIVDLDAALGQGSNREAIEGLLELADGRVGGGIRDPGAARAWLDAGATKVVLGTAAVPAVLRELPSERVVAALDAVHGEVVVEGWRRATGATIEERIEELKPLVGGFLITFVEREGRMTGIDLDRAEALVRAAAPRRVTFAGGITTAAEVAALDRLGADAQVGMALYRGVLDLGDAIAAPLSSDREDGLWPTVVADEHGSILGLCWSNAESVRAAVARRAGVYWSRGRGLWIKGESSGATQELLRVELDCDRDALRFVVRQRGTGFCHRGTWSCFGNGGRLGMLERLIASRRAAAPAGSYTRRLFDERGLLEAKLVEEARELASASGRDHVVCEAADLLYFTLAALARAGATLEDVERELERRGRVTTRRGGDRKE